MDGYILLGFYWTAFYVFHSLLASITVKEIIRKLVPYSDTYYRLFYNLFALASLGYVLYYHTTLPVDFLIEKNFISQGLAFIFIFSSVLVMWFAFQSYSMQEFIGLKSEQIQTSPKLSIKGLNKWVRHPLYLGILLGLVGILLWETSIKNVLAAAILLNYLFIGIYLEEQKLLIYFGEEYRIYRKKTKKIIPFVW